MEAPRAAARARASVVVPMATAVLAFGAYAATAARTITWWDGSRYALAAVTLGIAPAPGSLILTLLGWIVSRIPIVHPVAFRLNLSAALLSAILAGLVAWLGARLATPEDREPGAAEWCAGAIAGLTFAFGVTPWTYAVQFTPYGLSALWTALILIAALAWWRRPEGSRGHARLFVLFLLFGLDLSVHRTNMLLLPAAACWFALRTPSSGSFLRDAGAALGGFVLGLAFHLLLIPMAAARPWYMNEDPSTLAGLWSYVTVEQKGGGFLFNIFPRKADFLTVQVADYAKFLASNLGMLLYLPAILAVLGWVLILRHHPRRATGLMLFFLCAGPGAIVYFNLPHNYFRPIDRHYLPSLVILAPWMAVGAAALLRGAARVRGGPALGAALAIALALPAISAWRANRRVCDLSRVRFAETVARDLLQPLPPDAILFTNGDNDSFPLWYLQRAEGVRLDVTVINLPSANVGIFIEQLRRQSPGLAHLLEDEPMLPVLLPTMVPGRRVVTVVERREDLGLPAGVAPPDSLAFTLPDTQYGSDRVVADVLSLNRWMRPVHIAWTVPLNYSVTWLKPFARLDGLAWRIIPSNDSTVWDVDHFRTVLLERVSYAGLADTTVAMDPDSRAMCSNYYSALMQLAHALLERGRAREALATLDFADAHVPPARLGMDPEDTRQYRAMIEEAAAREAAGR